MNSRIQLTFSFHSETNRHDQNRSQSKPSSIKTAKFSREPKVYRQKIKNLFFDEARRFDLTHL